MLTRVTAAALFLAWNISVSPPAHAGVDDVDVFIGSGGPMTATSGTFPGAILPFGLVRLSPDASEEPGSWRRWLAEELNVGTAGYYDADSYILGFSLTRLSGAGIYEGGMLRVSPALTAMPPSGPEALRFTHSSEVASPGFYSVTLAGGIRVELTATSRAGIERYTFPAHSNPTLTIDTGSALGTLRPAKNLAPVETKGDRELSGEAVAVGTFSERWGGAHAFFAASLSPPFTRIEQHGNLVVLSFAASDAAQTVELRTALSFVNGANARGNLDAEVGSRSFETLKAAAAAAWSDRLGRISISTSDESMKKIFYTALYHAETMPTTFTDVNGHYVGMDGARGQAHGFVYRTDLSLWDTFRAVQPLYSLIAPDIQRDVDQSLVAMSQQLGALPLWPAGVGDARCMIGDPAAIVLADAWRKGERSFDASPIVALLVAAKGRGHCLEAGYCPADQEPESVSRTLDYAWADAAGASLAEAAGDGADAVLLRRRAAGYRELWNAQTRHFQPRRRDQSWKKPFFPGLLTFVDDLFGGFLSGDFTEGSPSQWRWAVPWDAAGLAQLFGGPAVAASELNEFFEGASPERAALIPSSAYWHGNEHDLHAAYLFDDFGRPELTQKWVRWALTTRYAATVDGLAGQDDAGAISAWYVFSALGLYPRAGTTQYWLGAPLVETAAIKLADGKTLKIVAQGQSRDAPYVASVTLNGQRLCAPFVEHAAIADGGELVFTMVRTPAVKGGYACDP